VVTRGSVTVIPDPSVRPCLTADEAFAELDIDRTTGYRAIKEGTFPVPVIRVGRLIRVPTAALRRLLDPTVATDTRVDDAYPDDATAPTAGDSPSLRLVPRPETAHKRTQVATRPDRTGGQP
jgi:predicted DNA-binding transcriptional regulator AlpA